MESVPRQEWPFEGQNQQALLSQREASFDSALAEVNAKRREYSTFESCETSLIFGLFHLWKKRNIHHPNNEGKDGGSIALLVT